MTDPHLRALAGTRVELAVHCDKRLKSALLRVNDGQDIPAQVGADGLSFTASFIVEESGRYGFRLEDHEGFLGGIGRYYQLTSVPDEKPSVNIDEPRQNVFATSQASVPLKVVAKDDLALRDINLLITRSEEPAKVLSLYRAADQPTAGLLGAGDQQSVLHQWALAPYNFQPGDRITFLAIAGDYKPQTAQSHPRYLQIVTPEQMLDQLGRRQGMILEKLEQIVRAQREAQKRTRLVQIQLDKAGRVAKEDHDELQGAELTQRQVERGLLNETDGVQALIAGLLIDLQANRLDDPETVARMNDLSQRITEVSQKHLPVIERDLTNSLKQSQLELTQQPPRPASLQDISQLLTTATEHQESVIQILEGQLRDLARWDDARRFRGELTQIQEEQRKLADAAARLLPKVLSANSTDRPALEAETAKHAQNQKDLADTLDRMLKRMEDSASQAKAADPEMAETIADALTEARERAISGQMRNASRMSELPNDGQRQRFGEAVNLQRKLTADLQEVVDVLSTRRENDLTKLVRKLKEAEGELTNLRRQQAQLRRQMQEAAKQGNAQQRQAELERLSRRQQQLAQDIDRFARRLKRLQAEKAGQSAREGAQRLANAAQQAQQGAGDAAEQQAQQAEKDLDDAQQKLAEARQQAEFDLAFEQLSKVKDSLASLRERQEKMVADTKRLDDLRKAQNNQLTSGQQDSLQALSDTQRGLQEETNSLTNKLESAEVFALALKGASGEMEHAADLLGQQKTDAPTQTAENNALRRFDHLLDALKNDPSKPNEAEGADGGDGDSKQKQKPPGDGIPAIAQIKMLKFLQLEINERTRLLGEDQGISKPLNPDQQREYARLSEQQGTLADLVRNLTKPKDDNPEDNPDSLPLPDEKPPADSPNPKPLEKELPDLDSLLPDTKK